MQFKSRNDRTADINKGEDREAKPDSIIKQNPVKQEKLIRNGDANKLQKQGNAMYRKARGEIHREHDIMT